MENAAPMAVGNGVDRTGASEGNQLPAIYPSLRSFATAVVAARFHLSPHMARVVCELASIGGRPA